MKPSLEEVYFEIQRRHRERSLADAAEPAAVEAEHVA